MAMDQCLLIPFLGEWTSIHPAILMWTKGHQGFDPYPNKNQTASNSCGWLQCPWYPPKSPLNLVSVDG